MTKCLQGLHPNEWLFITEYWNVLQIIKGPALICLEGSDGLSARNESKTAAAENSCMGRRAPPTRVIMTNSCGPGRRESRVVVRLATSSFDLLHAGRDITAPHTWLGNQVLWIYHGARAEWTTVRKVLVNYAYTVRRGCGGGSHSTSRWTWLPDLTLGSVHNALVERVWAQRGGQLDHVATVRRVSGVNLMQRHHFDANKENSDRAARRCFNMRKAKRRTWPFKERSSKSLTVQ